MRLLDRSKAVNGRDFYLDQEIELIVLPDKLFIMICSLFVWNLEYAHADDVQVIDHQVKHGLLLIGFVLLLICFEDEMV